MCHVSQFANCCAVTGRCSFSYFKYCFEIKLICDVYYCEVATETASMADLQFETTGQRVSSLINPVITIRFSNHGEVVGRGQKARFKEFL